VAVGDGRAKEKVAVEEEEEEEEETGHVKRKLRNMKMNSRRFHLKRH
jgi:hypothetical protein